MDADICIVGAGPAGITVAREMIASPLRVMLLESGGHEESEHTRALNHGGTTGHAYHALHTCRRRCIGGSTSFWGGWCRPLDGIDFEEREWLPHSGWPFSRAQLDAEYERAHSVCKLGPYDYHPATCLAMGRMPVAESDKISEMVFQISPTRFGAVYLPALRQANNVYVTVNATVLALQTDETHRTIAAVKAATDAGNQFTVRARVYVLAAGGIENPRLLLVSEPDRHGGLANENDLVGRFFSDHLHVPIGTTEVQQLGSIRRYQPRSANGVTFRGGLSFMESFRRKSGLPGFAITFHNDDDPHDVFRLTGRHSGYSSLQQIGASLAQRRRPEKLRQHFHSVAADVRGTLRQAYRRLVKPPLRRVAIGCRAEQMPNPENRVRLDSTRDRFGVPRVILNWKLAEQDIKNLQTAQDIFLTELRAASGNAVVSAKDVSPAAHHMGTTRMHRDPRRGVVNEDCRAHTLSNLYLAGTSVFPTGGWATPTLTVVALALRLADHLKRIL